LKADASIPELGQSSGNALMSTSGLLWRERERERGRGEATEVKREGEMHFF